MTQEQLEGNRLIAEFMGATKEQWYPPNDELEMTGIYFSYPKDKCPDNELHVGEKFLKYNSSWDWLMPACKRFDSLTMTRSDLLAVHIALCEDLKDAVSSFDIDKAFKELIECIEYNNKHFKP